MEFTFNPYLRFFLKQFLNLLSSEASYTTALNLEAHVHSKTNHPTSKIRTKTLKLQEMKEKFEHSLGIYSLK